MRAEETTQIAVCAGAPSELEQVLTLVQAAGRWTAIPVAWPDAAALSAARQVADIYLLHADEPCCEQLIDQLAARPEHAPLIITGSDPAAGARPDLWLPRVPTAPELARLLHHLLADPAAATSAPAWRRKSDMIIGTSAPTTRLLHALDLLAPATTPVLISGESGVGKELVARALHYCGPRAAAPFVAINCAAIPESLIEAELFGYQRGAFTGAVAAHAGAFEAADKGTLFLDEIGDMPLPMQAKLLRVLETGEVQRLGSTEARPVDFRLVSATNRKLDEEVRAGRFREDLYYRVQVYPIDVPPLRERIEDIPLLITHQLAVIAQRDGRPAARLTAAALEQLVTYAWPGNVRELVNLLERATLLAGDERVIDAEHVVLTPIASTPAEPALLPYRDAKAKFELDYYTQLLRIAGGNVTLAAKLGHKTRKEIYDALKRLGLDATSYRAMG